MKKYILPFLLFLLFLLVGLTASGQQKITTSIDKTKNKIGAQFNLTLKTTVDTTANVVFPGGNNFGKMQVIRNYVVDTVKKNNQYELIKKYGLTQFDSGKYSIPGLKVFINKKPYYSDSLRVEVGGIKVDTLKQKMYDIKPIIDVDQPIGSWWKYLLVLLLIIGIGFLVYVLVKRLQKKKLEKEIYKTPIERATSLLKSLENKQLWQKGEIKSYYSELTDIARNYIEEEIQIPAMESTTTELIAGLRKVANQKKMKLSKETFINLEKVLKQADLVKFAKSQPLDFEIEEDKKRIENSIVLIHKAVPEVVIDEGDSQLDELLRQKLLRKQRNKRIILAVVSVIVLLFGTLVFLIATKGFDYVKDNFIGHATKELLEGEWVSSEYGNPGVTIETPKILKRLDLSKSMPKQVIASMQAISGFGYGSLQGSFYISVTTMKPKQAQDFDLEKGLTGAVNGIGGQHINFNKKDFSTKQGAEGIRGYGTMEIFNPILKQTAKVYYEMLLFKENEGMEQILIIHEEGDKYADQVSDRIVNSIEVKTAAE